MLRTRRQLARRILLSVGLAVLGFVIVIAVEVVLAFRVERLEGFTRAELDRRIGEGASLRVSWIGDSTSAGVGASSPDRSLPVLVGQGMDRSVELSVLSVSGATTAAAVAEQLPDLAATDPDWVFVAIGSNDVTHLTTRGALRSGLETLLAGVEATQPERIVVLGVAEFGGTPLFARPLRTIAGLRAHQLDAVVADVAAAHGAVYVPIARLTGPRFAADPIGTHARDRFHPNDAGYRFWADATLETLRSDGLI
jgi:lysophospholipase L1-like esterase